MKLRALPAVLIVLFGINMCVGPRIGAAQSPQGTPAADEAAAPDKVAAMLADKLSLSDDQKSQIEPIIADRQAQLRALRNDQSLRRLQRAREAKRIFKESDKKIGAILTPDQKKQYAALEKEMRERMKDRAQQGQAGAGV